MVEIEFRRFSYGFSWRKIPSTVELQFTTVVHLIKHFPPSIKDCFKDMRNNLSKWGKYDKPENTEQRTRSVKKREKVSLEWIYIIK